MLKFLRKRKILKRIMWGVAILVIPAFVWWGAGSAAKEKRGPTYAGLLFGKKVSFEEYDNSFKASYTDALMIYGKNINQLEKSFLNQQAWDRITLLREAKKRGITVTDKEVINEIKQYPFFQAKGQFDDKIYELMLKNVFHLEARNFEEQIRGTLVIAKLINSSLGKVEIPDEELKKLYAEHNDKVKISYLLFEPKSFTQEVKIEDKEVSDYYQEHKNDFKKDEQVKVNYIPITYAEMEAKVNVTEETIKSYYDEHLKDYTLPPEVVQPPVEKKEQEAKEAEKLKYRPLLEVSEQIKKRIQATQSMDLARDIAKKISSELLDTPDLEKVAKDHSLAVSESNFFTKQESIPDIGWSLKFNEEAFALKPGEISNVVTTAKGCYLLQLKDTKKPYTQTLDEVKSKINDILLKDQSKRLAKNKAEVELLTIQKMISQPNSKLEDICNNLSLALNQTQPFSRQDYVPGIGMSPEFGKTVFSLKAGELSGVIETPAGFLIARADEFIPMDEAKFNEEKDAFKEKSIQEKRGNLANEWFSRLREKAKLKDNMAELK